MGRAQHADVAFGSIVASNIFNHLGIAWCMLAVNPIPVPSAIAAFDVWIILAAFL
jgi:cation:H+ antiporter